MGGNRRFFRLANEAAVTLVFGLANEGAGVVINQIDDDGWAWVELAPYGEAKHVDMPDGPRGRSIVRRQVFDKSDATRMANEFNGRLRTRLGMGAPWYIGHPYTPGMREYYKDTRAYGRIKKLKPGETALMAHVKFNSAGIDLIRSEAFEGHSPEWDAIQQSGNVFRPVRLVSTGFTNKPNLPVPSITAANEGEMTLESSIEENDDMNLKQLREGLIACGRLKPGAPDEEIEGVVLALANEAAESKATLAKHERLLLVFGLANEAMAGLGEMIREGLEAYNAKLSEGDEPMTMESLAAAAGLEVGMLDALLAGEAAPADESVIGKLKAALGMKGEGSGSEEMGSSEEEKALANELAAALVDSEISAGKVLVGNREAAIAKLMASKDVAADRVTLANEFGPSTGMKTAGTTPGNLAERRGNDDDRQAARATLVNECMAELPASTPQGKRYELGWNAARRKRPELFEAVMKE